MVEATRAVATAGADFVWWMKDVLELYAQPYDEQRLVGRTLGKSHSTILRWEKRLADQMDNIFVNVDDTRRLSISSAQDCAENCRAD